MNTLPPIPVGGYLDVTVRVMEVIFGAFAEAAPEISYAASYGSANPLAISGKKDDGSDFLLFTWFAEEAFTIALKLTSSMTLVPYLLVAAYGVKLATTGEIYRADRRGRIVDWVRGVIAMIYAIGMLTAGGTKFLMLSALLYAPVTILFALARREQNVPIFTRVEGLLFGIIAVMAAAGFYGLASGAISV